MARVTLEKVAKETGLSVSTVSRALRGHSNVTAVEQIAAKLKTELIVRRST